MSSKRKRSKSGDQALKNLRDWFHAIREGDWEAGLSQLAKKTVPTLNCVDPDDPKQPTGLIVATQLNRFAFAKRVLLNEEVRKQNFLEVNKTDLTGRHALWYAVVNDSVAFVRLLAENGANLNYVDKKTGMTALYLSVVLERPEICQQLIIAGVNVNLHRMDPTAARRTPLIESIVTGNEGISEMLLNAFCDLKLTSSYGYNALHYAVACRRYSTLKLLLQRARALVHSESLHGCTAMTIAIDQDLPDVIRLLIQEGAYDPNRRYRWNETPLDHAIKTYSEDSALALVLNGCEIKRSQLTRAKRMGLNNLQILMEKFTLFTRVGSLKERCRMKISLLLRQHRALCHVMVKDAVILPGLSDECRSYILHEKEELEHDYIYRERGFDAARCPLDCQSDCIERFCPVLEPTSYTDE